VLLTTNGYGRMSLASWLAPPLLPAVVVMVLFALIPRQRLVLAVAVIGWAAVWLDSRLTAEPLDLTGLAAVAAAMGVLLHRSRGKVAAGSSDHANHRS
jgi:hypothetical protein